MMMMDISSVFGYCINAMKITCDYCGNFISDTDELCPFCGAPNAHLVRSASGVPKTIEELRAFAESHNLPLDKMRVFIGEDYKSPKAFGIFKKPNGDFVVYKNKADGSRAVRYEGKDEAYAVNELYQKMKSEISLQHTAHPKSTRKGAPIGTANRMAGGARIDDADLGGGASPGRTAGSSLSRSSASSGSRAAGARNRKPKRTRGCLTAFLIAVGIIIILAVIGNLLPGSPKRGYYTYDGDQYYYDNNRWYVYSPLASWIPATIISQELQDHYGDYYDSEYYDTGYDASDFRDSDYYTEPSYDTYHTTNDDTDYSWDDWDSDWDDDDWDWDSDWDWDTDTTDWDSDW